jgi:hypothetical protein
VFRESTRISSYTSFNKQQPFNAVQIDPQLDPGKFPMPYLASMWDALKSLTHYQHEQKTCLSIRQTGCECEFLSNGFQGGCQEGLNNRGVLNAKMIKTYSKIWLRFSFFMFIDLFLLGVLLAL